jgi:hypothetical protein
MISLKSYCGPLSKVLGLTPDALYERQRVLVRSDYLSGAIAGKGPGSGVRATIRNVTKLILSTLATDALFEIDGKTRGLAALKHVDAKCPFTGERRFQNALEKALSTPELAASVAAITVRREDMGARIHFELPDRRHFETSEFGHWRLPTEAPAGMGRRITATLEGWSIEVISGDLQDIAADAPLRSQIKFK